MSAPELSGVDMARAALAQARAAAKTRPPAGPQQKTRRTRAGVRTVGDPTGCGAVIVGMMAERGWEPPERGGSILDQWPAIAPELAAKVAAVRFEHGTGCLHLRPVSDAYATQLRLHQRQVLARVRQAPGGASVRSLKILPVGAAPKAPTAGTAIATAEPAVPTPPRTGEPKCAGYQEALARFLEHRPDHTLDDPDVERAMHRQEAALRAGREPETVHLEELARQEGGVRRVDPTAASRRAALAYKRSGKTGIPRRAFDVS